MVGGEESAGRKECLDARLGSSVGLLTLNERVRQIAQLVPSWQKEVLEHRCCGWKASG
jgi:hypothetical protein